MNQCNFENRIFLILVFCSAVVIAAFTIIAPVVAADTVTRGNMFTVSVIGKPNTAYYVWFKGTSTMSGQPGDQPPLIVAYTSGVEFDPDDGPYTIGNYKFNNGNGRTIREDVAPSSETVLNTRYYAEVTTDDDGYGIVQFQTSSATADRTFTIKAENPAAPGEEVPVKLGIPTTRTTITTSRTATIAQIPPLPVMTTPATQLTTQTTTMTIGETSSPTMVPPTQRTVPLSSAVIVLAVMGALVLARRAL